MVSQGIFTSQGVCWIEVGLCLHTINTYHEYVSTWVAEGALFQSSSLMLHP